MDMVVREVLSCYLTSLFNIPDIPSLAYTANGNSVIVLQDLSEPETGIIETLKVHVFGLDHRQPVGILGLDEVFYQCNRLLYIVGHSSQVIIRVVWNSNPYLVFEYSGKLLGKEFPVEKKRLGVFKPTKLSVEELDTTVKNSMLEGSPVEFSIVVWVHQEIVPLDFSRRESVKENCCVQHLRVLLSTSTRGMPMRTSAMNSPRKMSGALAH